MNSLKLKVNFLCKYDIEKENIMRNFMIDTNIDRKEISKYLHFIVIKYIKSYFISIYWIKNDSFVIKKIYIFIPNHKIFEKRIKPDPFLITFPLVL